MKKGFGCIGFVDKLYWRRVGPVGHAYHCFSKVAGRKKIPFVSLCGRFDLIRSGGQACSRPAPWNRCGICDGLEMKRRGWDESGPASP